MAIGTAAATRPAPSRGAVSRGAPPARRDQRRPPRPPRPAALPPHLWFADRLLAVLTGRSPITCLAGRVRDTAYDRLWELADARADWRSRARGRTPYVRSCRVARTLEGALEVTAVVELARDAVRAIAFRLERSPTPDATWRCTAVEAH